MSISHRNVINHLGYLAVIVYFWLYIAMYWFGVKGMIAFDMSLHRLMIYFLCFAVILSCGYEFYASGRATAYECIFWTFILYCLFVIITNKYFGMIKFDVNGISVFKYSLYLILQYIICYFIGRFFFFEFNSHKIKFIAIGHILCLFILLIFVSEGSILIDVSDVEHGQRGIYLFTSDYLAFFGLALVSQCRTRKSLILAVSLSAILIFCFLSRSSFFIFLMVCFFVFAKKYKLLSILLICCLLLAIYWNIDYLYENYPRMFFFLDYASDSSFKGRELQKQLGYIRLYNNWFLGDYSGQIESLQYIGEYIHNILSYWRQFGLLGFILIGYLVIIYPCYLVYKMLLGREKYSKLFLLIALYTISQALFSRSYAWPYLFVLVGIVSTYVSSKKCASYVLGENI